MWQQFQRLLVARVVVRWRIVQFSLPQCKKKDFSAGASTWISVVLTGCHGRWGRLHSQSCGFLQSCVVWNTTLKCRIFFFWRETNRCYLARFFFREIPPFRNQHVNEPFPLRSRVDFVRKKKKRTLARKNIFSTFTRAFQVRGTGMPLMVVGFGVGSVDFPWIYRSRPNHKERIREWAKRFMISDGWTLKGLPSVMLDVYGHALGTFFFFLETFGQFSMFD